MDLFTKYHVAYDKITEHITNKEIILEKYGHVQGELPRVHNSNPVNNDNNHLEDCRIFMIHILEVNLI